VRYAAPARLVGRQAVPVPLVSQRHRSRPAASASPLRLVRFPGLTVPAWLVSQPRRSNSAGFPASPFPVRLVLPPRRSGPSGCPSAPAPRAARQCQTPAANTGFPAFPASRGSPRMVPVPCGECISTPSASVTQEPARIHLDFFPHPHVVHRIPPVIRIFQRLSTGFCTAHPQVTRRNSSPRRQADLRPTARRRQPRHRDPSAPCRPRSQAGRWHIGPVLAGPTAHRPSPARSHRARNAPGKYDCPFGVAGLPWIYDHTPGAEATRVHEPGVAASGCPDRGSGCRVSANRHLPAAAPRKFPRGGFRLPGAELTVPQSLSYRLDN
jgi:hypothetical protein